jgi:hypothetical protein
VVDELPQAGSKLTPFGGGLVRLEVRRVNALIDHSHQPESCTAMTTMTR